MREPRRELAERPYVAPPALTNLHNEHGELRVVVQRTSVQVPVLHTHTGTGTVQVQVVQVLL